MDVKHKTVEIELSPSLEFLSSKLTAIKSAGTKSLPHIYQEIEDKAQSILQALENTSEGRQLQQQKPGEYKQIRQFLIQIKKVRLKRKKIDGQSVGNGVFTGAVTSGLAAAGYTRSRSVTSRSTELGNAGTSSGFGLGAALAVGGLFAAGIGAVMAMRYYKVQIKVSVPEGKRFVVEIVDLKPSTNKECNRLVLSSKEKLPKTPALYAKDAIYLNSAGGTIIATWSRFGKKITKRRLSPQDLTDCKLPDFPKGGEEHIVLNSDDDESGLFTKITSLCKYNKAAYPGVDIDIITTLMMVSTASALVKSITNQFNPGSP